MSGLSTRYDIFSYCSILKQGRDSSVGIATGYRLKGRGSIPSRDRIILFSSRPALGLTRGPFPRGKSGRGLTLTTHLHLLPKSRTVELFLHSPYLFFYFFTFLVFSNCLSRLYTYLCVVSHSKSNNTEFYYLVLLRSELRISKHN
jgi:hypothetical protein